ncbi:MAG: NADH:flavin oxidoreductase [Planctomycetota bacterium]|nr:NADH:flavin oxidoreductase [Planctomycetota bacterium]
MAYPRITKLKTPEQFSARLDELGISIPFDPEMDHQKTSLGKPFDLQGKSVGNRFAILPMEGWDGTPDGKPTDLTRRRWRNFGISGAKLIWGGEAIAVNHAGRANPNQLLLNENNLSDIASLRELLVTEHQETFGQIDDLHIGLQLTHSGRFACPNHRTQPEPKTIYAHPVLDQKFEIEAGSSILTDDDLKNLIEHFIAAAILAERAGFHFVDIKHCHGYLGHELLSGFDRDGSFGGTFENRTRFLREITSGIQAETKLQIGTRISIFDFAPFQKGSQGIGEPVQANYYTHAFGGDGSGRGIDLAEPDQFLSLLNKIGVPLVCTTAGSPYYNPHIQRPALFPPSDGYHPPEDPLVGVARQINQTAEMKKKHPDLVIVGSAYSYLQEWIPHVGQKIISNQMADFIGLGRMALSYPEMPADLLSGKALYRKKICRTFSDCTTAPRNGMVSGCFPLDPFYRSLPEHDALKAAKKSG